MIICGQCGAHAIRIRITIHPKLGRLESCNVCDGHTTGLRIPRDAEGERVHWDEPRYSVAAGRWIKNAQAMADYCRSKGLTQQPDLPDFTP